MTDEEKKEAKRVYMREYRERMKTEDPERYQMYNDKHRERRMQITAAKKRADAYNLRADYLNEWRVLFGLQPIWEHRKPIDYDYE